MQGLQLLLYAAVVIEAAVGRRDRKKQQTRAALAAAALRLVDERGLDHVTVEEISEAADVSPRTFFNYFAAKDDALLGDPLLDEEAVRAAVRGAPAGTPSVTAVLDALGPVIERIESERDSWLLRMRVIKNNPSLLPALLGAAQRSENDLVEDLAARLGVSSRDRYPQLVASLTGAAFRTAMMRWATLGEDGVSLADETRAAFAALHHGLTDPDTGGTP